MARTRPSFSATYSAASPARTAIATGWRSVAIAVRRTRTVLNDGAGAGGGVAEVPGAVPLRPGRAVPPLAVPGLAADVEGAAGGARGEGVGRRGGGAGRG